MLSGIKRMWKHHQEKNREKKIVKDCRCLCICPGCSEPLNDQADCIDTDLVRYKCNKCGDTCAFNFNVAPVPILWERNGESRY